MMRPVLALVIACVLLPAPARGQPGPFSTWESSGRSHVPEPTPGLPPVVAVAAVYRTRLALGVDGTLWAWSSDWAGPGPPARVPGLEAVVAIAAADQCWGFDGWNVAATADGTVWEWPAEGLPRQVPGLAGVTALSGMGRNLLALTEAGTVWQWSSCGALPARVRGLGDITAIAAGASHGLAVRRDGTLWAWGRNDAGQLGDGTWIDRERPVRVRGGLSSVVAVASGAYFGMALTADGRAWRWGGLEWYVRDCSSLNRPEELALGAAGIGAGWRNGYVMKPDGTTWAWGDNTHGELGDGTWVESCDLVQTRLFGIAAATSAWDGAVFLVTEPRLASVTFPRDRVTGCRSAAGTVTLAGPVPRGEVSVALATDSVSANVPASLTLTAGQRSAAFRLTTRPVAAEQAVTVRAVAVTGEPPGWSVSLAETMLTLEPMGVQGIWLEPNPALGSGSVSMAVRLPCAAGPRDVTVEVGSSNPALAAPVTPVVTVPSGAQAILFPLVTQAVATETTVRLWAKAAGTVRTARLVLTPP